MPIGDTGRVAVVFELVVNFANHESAVARALEICDAWPPVLVRGIDLSLEGPYVTRFSPDSGDYIEFSVGVAGVRFGGVDSEINASDLTHGEITTIGLHLYDLLRRFDGYVAAVVGWDPEEVVDLRILRSRIDESGLDRLKGLVLASALVLDWGHESQFSEFAAGYGWVPYGASSDV